MNAYLKKVILIAQQASILWLQIQSAQNEECWTKAEKATSLWLQNSKNEKYNNLLIIIIMPKRNSQISTHEHATYYINKLKFLNTSTLFDSEDFSLFTSFPPAAAKL